jgi:polyketide synthase-associated protein
MALRQKPSNIYDIDLAETPDASIGADIMEQLANKGFSMINLGLEDGILAQALEEAKNMSDRFEQPCFQVMEGLLGPEGSCRIAEMDAPDSDIESSELPALKRLDLQISEVGRDLLPYAEQHGFIQVSHRTNTIIHEHGAAEDDTPPLTEKVVTKWLSQFQRHQIMAILFLGPSKGTLELRPYDVDDMDAFEVRTAPGMLVMLRPEILGHRFFAPGNAWALSSFFLTSKSMQKYGASLTLPMTPVARELDEWVLERLRQLKSSEHEDTMWDPEIPRDWQLAMNHMFHKGQMIAIKGVGIMSPRICDTENWFPTQVAGIDLVTEVPMARWDHSKVYVPYEVDPDCAKAFKTYCRHCSLMEGVDQFDPKLFGMSPAEAKSIDPNQRLVLEVGYQSLYKGGLRKKQLMNANIGHYCGFGCLEWQFAEKSGEMGAFAATGSAASIVSNRFNFCLGMKGPSMTIDTEGASSLTALYLGAEACQKKGRGQQNPYSVASGVHLLLSHMFWPNHTAAGWLSREGRCLTFDARADGYVRSDACVAVTVKCFDDIDGEVKEEDKQMVGLLAAGVMNQNGKGASLAAPNGPAEQEAIAEAIRNAHIDPCDVDGVEAYGLGAFLPDAIEVGSLLRGHRNELNKESLIISAYKTGVGNMVEAGALCAFIRTLVNGQWGFVPPNKHLRQINPHIDAVDTPACIATETMEFRLKSSFYGTLSRGFGGSNVYVINHCQQDPSKFPPPKVVQQTLAFWPGGGGTLEPELVPEKTYYLAGSFNKWGEAKAMERTPDGGYGFTVTLGENCFEQFQIWLDGDSSKMLHPGWPKAGKDAPVIGPTEDDSSHGLNWMIDGRGDIQDVWKPATEVAESERSSILRTEFDYSGTEYALLQETVPTPDSGKPGDRYRVRLQILGKWRTVNWYRIDAPSKDLKALVAPNVESGRYYIVGSWCDWSFQEMSASSEGVFTLDVTMARRGGEFQIVRDMDWSQVLFPATPLGSGTEYIVGPRDGGHGLNWYLDGFSGDQYRITFKRHVHQDKDTKSVSWEKI